MCVTSFHVHTGQRGVCGPPGQEGCRGRKGDPGPKGKIDTLLNKKKINIQIRAGWWSSGYSM